MYKVSQAFNTPESKTIQEAFGSYNDFPPNWREITQEEFASSLFFSYTPDWIDFRQMLPPRVPGKPSTYSGMVSAYLYFFWNKTGIGIVSTYEGKTYNAKKVLKYFKFGCDHKYRELSREESAKKGRTHHGMCYHIEECTTCGHIWEYDSSD
jgi:hypothetical protein